MGATGVAEPQQAAALLHPQPAAALLHPQLAAALRGIGGAVKKDNAPDAIEDLQGLEVALVVAVTQSCATIICTLIPAVKHWHFAIGYW